MSEKKKIREFIKNKISDLKNESTAFFSNGAQKSIGVDLLSVDQLKNLPSYSRFLREARKSGIDIDSVFEEDLFNIPGVIQYLKARRVYDIIEGRDATTFDIKVIESILDKIDGKT